MELNAPLWPFTVRQTHYQPILGPGRLHERWRQRTRRQQRMIPCRLERRRHPVKKRISSRVMNLGRASVVRRRSAHDRSACQRGDALMPEANPEQRHVGVKDCIPRYAEICLAFRPPRPGRYHDVVEPAFAQLFPRNLIVSYHHGSFVGEVREDVNEVVGKRIIVVDHKSLHGYRSWCTRAIRSTAMLCHRSRSRKIRV